MISLVVGCITRAVSFIVSLVLYIVSAVVMIMQLERGVSVLVAVFAAFLIHYVCTELFYSILGRFVMGVRDVNNN